MYVGSLNSRYLGLTKTPLLQLMTKAADREKHTVWCITSMWILNLKVELVETESRMVIARLRVGEIGRCSKGTKLQVQDESVLRS